VNGEIDSHQGPNDICLKSLDKKINRDDLQSNVAIPREHAEGRFDPLLLPLTQFFLLHEEP
jgi:hypothetical protein